MNLATDMDCQVPGQQAAAGDAGGERVLKLTLLVVLGCLFCVWFSALHANTGFVRFESLTIEDGLGQNTVGSLLQDSRGFIWLGTEAGLQRYDGQEFRTFRHDPAEPDSLADNFVISLAEGPDGSIWVGTMAGGIHRLDQASGRMERIRVRGAEPDTHGLIWAIHVNDRGDVWAATQDGALYRAVDQNEFRVLAPEVPMAEIVDGRRPIAAPFVAVTEDVHGDIVFGTADGLVRLNDDMEFVPWEKTTIGDSVPSGFFVSALNVDRQGNLWAGGAGSVFRVSSGGRVEQFGEDHPLGQAALDTAIWAIDQDPEGYLWFATFSSGLWRYDPDQESLMQFRGDPSMPRGLAEDNLMTAMVDHSGLLWIGTESHGAQRLNPQALRFGQFGHHPIKEDSLPHPVVWAIENKGDKLWVGTQEGLAVMNWPDTEEASQVRRFHGRSDEETRSLQASHISGVRTDSKGGLWVATLSGLWYGQDDPDAEDGMKLAPVNVAEALDQDYAAPIPSITVDSYGNLLIAWEESIAARFSDNERWEVLLDAEELRLGYIHAIWLRNDSDLWISGEHGLLLYDLAADRPRYLIAGDDRSGEAEHISLRHGGVFGFDQAEDGSVWLGSQTGLYWVNLDAGEWRRYSQGDGMPSDSVYAVALDSSGYVWVSTAQGLTRLDPLSKEFISFDVSDGLQSNEFNGGVVAKLEDGRLAFGGLNGINVFRPEKMEMRSPPPPVSITAVQVGDRLIDDLLLGSDTQITVPHYDNFITVDFSALDFRNPRKNRFQYRLDGFDEDWRDAARFNQAIYTNLPPGHYTLQVKAANSLGVWNEEGESLRLRVEAAPWWQPLAIVGYFILAFLVTAFLFRLYLRRLARERLIDRERERRELSERLQRVTARLAASVDPERVLDRLHENLVDLVDVEAMVLFTDNGEHYDLNGERGNEQAIKSLSKLPTRLSAAVDRAKQSGRVELLEEGELIMLAYPRPGDSSAVLVPLRVSGARYGFLALGRQGPAFNHQERELLSVVGTQAMVALEKANLFARVEELATTDGLTGLFNRRHIETLALEELARAERYSHGMALLMIDIDHFKTINDRYGHDEGDLCLKRFARLLTDETRRSDLVGRFGGEEFMAVLPETTRDKAVEVANRIRERVTQTAFSDHVLEGDLSVSIGMTIRKSGENSLQDMIRRADRALYQTKRGGRNQVVIATKDDDASGSVE